MQTNPAAGQNENVRWSDSPWDQSGKKVKGVWWKNFAKKPSVKFRMKDWTSKRSGDREDGEDDKLLCVIGESEVTISDKVREDQRGVHSIDITNVNNTIPGTIQYNSHLAYAKIQDRHCPVA